MVHGGNSKSYAYFIYVYLISLIISRKKDADDTGMIPKTSEMVCNGQFVYIYIYAMDANDTVTAMVNFNIRTLSTSHRIFQSR